MLASILAKNGVGVTIVDPKPHPKFTIGEATTPDSSYRLRIVGEKYDIPEISYLSNFHDLKSKVSENCGVKRSFSFLYHKENELHPPERTHQFPGPDNKVFGPDCHFLRQDVDYFLFRAAVKYGAKIENSEISSIKFDKDKVKVSCFGGTKITCSYVFDTSGKGSRLATRFGLRRWDEFDTNSRGLFTHMTGVKSLDESGSWPFDFKSLYGAKVPFSQSTLHHVFENGWFWVIPFSGKSDMTSVGLVLNRSRHCPSFKSPEKEFISYIKKFPTIQKQFENAKSVQRWVSTDRLQYSSERIFGDRFALSANSAGFIDPLYSSGLHLSTIMVDLLAEELLSAFKDNDFDIDRFKHIEYSMKESFTHYDEMISNSFLSFRHYDLWDAWFRVWVTGNFLGSVSNANLLLNYFGNGNKKYLFKTSKAPYNIPLGIQLREHRLPFSKALSFMNQFENNNISKNETRDSILNVIKNHKLIPSYFEWHKPTKRCTPEFGLAGSIRLYLWARMNTTKKTRQELFSYNPLSSFLYNYVSK
jgi:FADH2 O2-dependent halogenase